jgi:hypothetical protein
LREFHIFPGSGLPGAHLLLTELGFTNAPCGLLVFPSRVFFVTGRGFLSPTGFLRGAASGCFLPLDFLFPPLDGRSMFLIPPIHLGVL